MTYNPQKHHRRSIRLKDFDYSKPGEYFVTINTHRREPLFGEIQNGVMLLSKLGLMAEKCWLEIPQHYPGVTLDEFVIMPDHVHGIIVITEKNSLLDTPSGPPSELLVEPPSKPLEGPLAVPAAVPAAPAAVSPPALAAVPPAAVQDNLSEVLPDSHLPKASQEARVNRYQKIIPRSLGAIVRGYKIGVTKWARKNTAVQTVWHCNYYERVIRDIIELVRIREYIVNNPKNYRNNKDDDFCFS